jgi:alkanesulfonate monooxygenase SsuD/methylene tetrahydromethanopterin reductase-like flavin-dependent oxidoreductase (luciferase family)
VSDYGHELAFGTFLTPSARPPERVVELAQLADAVGLDLITFQDHPYQPAFADAWTLLSYVSARTRRIRLSGNVLNLPLRNPAVLARSVASLDLLSGGRVELGLGAGGFWDAIEAMGGRRLAPGQAVDALAEAIGIIRAIWDTEASGAVRADGQYYHVKGAKRGPAPAHPVGIWVGAYQPRMLRLTGRLADGWLPSLSYLQPGQLTAGNAIIDQAAADAGREPGSVRRLLNIGGGQSPDQLAELALTEGISTFILATDDPDDIRAYAAEVAPQVRELVAAARSGKTEAIKGPGVEPTPDDGTRLTSTPLWDEAARPTRAAPASTGKAAYSAAGAQLVAVHDMFRRELAAIRDLITEVQKGIIDAGQARSEISQMALRQNNWTLGAYCESYCRVLTEHHGAEDAMVFPHLRAREPGLAPVLDRLSEEHRVIHGLLDSVDRALVRLVADPGDLGELQKVTDLLTDALLSHLSYEERELIDPLARYGF